MRAGWLLQFGISGFGLLQDGNVGVSVFPESKEIFIGGAGLCPRGAGIRA